MLILFDIDATLIRTSGAGIRAMVRAGKALYGESFIADGVEFSGRLDPLIIADMLRVSGLEPTAARIAAVRAEYRARLGPVLEEGRRGVWALPGVHELLRALDARPDITVGLLTGNFAETGRMKLAACGLDPGVFRVCAWGDESPHEPPCRDHLPAIAIERYRARHGRPIDAGRVTIVGDTLHDVRCGLANGCRVLGVATGQFSVEQLTAAGAHRAVPDLSGTDDVFAWLTA